MINRRISEISCNESEFEKAKHTYEKALKESGCQLEMVFRKYAKSKRCRKRKIMFQSIVQQKCEDKYRKAIPSSDTKAFPCQPQVQEFI